MTIHDTQDWSSPGGQGPAQVIGDPVLTFGTLLLGEDPSGNAQAIQVDASGNVLTTGGYASLTGAGQATSPGELDQAGAFTVSTPSGDTVGFRVTDAGTGGIALSSDTYVTLNGLVEVDVGDSIVMRNSGGAGLLDIISSTANDVVEINLDGMGSQITIRARGSTTIGSEVATGTVTVASSSLVVLDGGNGGIVRVGEFTLDRVGFYGGGGISRQARPVTLADVITVLVKLGITA